MKVYSASVKIHHLLEFTFPSTKNDSFLAFLCGMLKWHHIGLLTNKKKTKIVNVEDIILFYPLG